MKTNEEYRLLEEQLTNATKQSVMLRVELKRIADQLFDVLGGSTKGYYHGLKENMCVALAALDATADLAGLVVCDAAPAMKVIRNEAGQVVAQNGDGGYFSPFNYVGKSFYLAKEKS